MIAIKASSVKGFASSIFSGSKPIRRPSSLIENLYQKLQRELVIAIESQVNSLEYAANMGEGVSFEKIFKEIISGYYKNELHSYLVKNFQDKAELIALLIVLIKMLKDAPSLHRFDATYATGERKSKSCQHLIFCLENFCTELKIEILNTELDSHYLFNKLSGAVDFGGKEKQQELKSLGLKGLERLVSNWFDQEINKFVKRFCEAGNQEIYNVIVNFFNDFQRLLNNSSIANLPKCVINNCLEKAMEDAFALQYPGYSLRI